MARLIRALGFVCASALLVASFACGSHKSSGQAKLSGSVQDLTGGMIANASLTANGGQSVTTDANGHFQFSITAQEMNSVTVQADSHATIVRAILPTDEELSFSLRPADLMTSFAVPTGSASAQSFVVTGDSASKLSVSIPPDSLVDGHGNPVGGQANIKLTFWDPNGSMQARPAALIAHSPFPGDNDIINTELVTFGMFQIDIEQGGEQLQIAANSNFDVIQQMPANMGNYLAGQMVVSTNNYLWYLDPNTGAWRLDGDSSFDANTNILSAALPHLSTWNYDNFSSMLLQPGCTATKIQYDTPPCQKSGQYQVGVNLGGCIQGTILDKSGKPVTGTGSLWLFDSEGIYEVEVPTDSSGHFCYNASVRAINGSATGYLPSNTLPNFTSAYRQPSNSMMADPIPGGCTTCQTSWCSGGFTPFGGGKIARWNLCALVKNSFDNGYDGGRPVTPSVPLSQTTVYTCAYCPGTAPSSCPVPGFQISNKCALAGGNSTVDACTKMLGLGDSCTSTTSMCCPAGTLCADGQCVPSTDTSVGGKRAL